jgi:hypothetical protein
MSLCVLFIYSTTKTTLRRLYEARFQVLTATNMKMTVLWDVASCSLVDIDRRFRGATSQKLYKIWGSHGGEDVDVGLLGCNAVWNCKKILTFRRNTLPPSSALKMALLHRRPKSTYIIRSFIIYTLQLWVIKWMMKWAWHVAHIGEMRNAFKILVGRLQGNRLVGRSRRIWKDNIEMVLTGAGPTIDWLWLGSMPHFCKIDDNLLVAWSEISWSAE